VPRDFVSFFSVSCYLTLDSGFFTDCGMRMQLSIEIYSLLSFVEVSSIFFIGVADKIFVTSSDVFLSAVHQLLLKCSTSSSFSALSSCS
jgi:hypothetical protein